MAVSYTHLDVYKRQKYHRTEFLNGEMPYMTKQYTVAGDLVDWMAGIGIGFNTMGNYESATPVSYTHLDVYKRQTCMRPPSSQRWGTA